MPAYRVLLIGNGERVPANLLRKLAAKADYVLAVDGGADAALRAHVTPHGVIGDLDSISPRAKKAFAGKILHVPTQENTDLEKALLWAVKHHATHLTLVGFVGDRWDFSVGNMLTLATWARKLNICLVGENWRIYPLAKSAQLVCTPGKRLSLIPVKPCTDVTLIGCKYPLANARLLPGTTRTLSNVTRASRVRISLTRGLLLVYVETN